MKKFLSFLIMCVFIAGLMFFAGCGGGGASGQKINGASDENQEINAESKEQQKEELPTTYVAKAGDTLWKIAQKPDIYGTKWQWPIIYDANRDILNSYKDVKEGQKLIIPRNVSAVEIEAAKERAMELGIPPREKNEGEVAGLEKKEKQGGGATRMASKGSKETGNEEGNMEEQPTPIPEPPKNAPKKGGINMMLVILVLVAFGAGITIFLTMQRKKDEEDEESQKS